MDAQLAWAVLVPKPRRALWPPLVAAAPRRACCLAPCLTRAVDTACAMLNLSLTPTLLAAQEYVQLDVAVVVGSTAYVGELVDELGDPDVAHLAITAAKIRWGRHLRGQAALEGRQPRRQLCARCWARRGLCMHARACAIPGAVGPTAPCRAAVQGGESPDLAAALRGVTHLKLFLCGLAVRPGLAVDELAQFAAPVGVSLVLPSGQGLGLAAEPAPADPL